MLPPLSIAERFTGSDAGWLQLDLYSAMLTVGEEFDYFSQRMGVGDADTCLLDSPFDYAHQSLLCVPRNLPDTSIYQRATQLAERLLPVIEIAVPGGCFFRVPAITVSIRSHRYCAISWIVLCWCRGMITSSGFWPILSPTDMRCW